MIINDKDATNTALGYEIIKNLSKKLIKLEIIDMLKFSRPAKMTSPISLHSCVANEWVRTDLLIKASKEENPIEKMKYLISFCVSGVHQGPMICRSRAPFNPILGETFQAYQKDGSYIYMEQTEHHPPTFNYCMWGPDHIFEMMGYGAVYAHLDGLNTIRGWREGKNIIKFKDGSIVSFNNFNTRINGIIMGDRIYNYYGDLIIKDFKNKVEGVCKLEDELKEGMLSKLFYGKKDAQYDEMKIEIRQLNPESKEKELKATGIGSWLGQVLFDGKEYWSIYDEPRKWIQDGLFLLPSDSMKREDLIAVLKADYDLAQKEKERLEELQRTDQKKRDNWKKKNEKK